MYTRDIILYFAFTVPVTLGWIIAYIQRSLWKGILGTAIGAGLLVLITFLM